MGSDTVFAATGEVIAEQSLIQKHARRAELDPKTEEQSLIQKHARRLDLLGAKKLVLRRLRLRRSSRRLGFHAGSLETSSLEAEIEEII